MKIDTRQDIANGIFTNPVYYGKHVVIIDDEVHVATTGEEAVKILEELREKHPNKQPVLSYIPKDETLILVLWR